MTRIWSSPLLPVPLACRRRRPALVERVCGVLANRAALLVLDNMEHVMDAATEVAVLLAAVPDLSVLVTSRGPLHLSGEHLFPVPALRLPAAEDWKRWTGWRRRKRWRSSSTGRIRCNPASR